MNEPFNLPGMDNDAIIAYIDENCPRKPIGEQNTIAHVDDVELFQPLIEAICEKSGLTLNGARAILLPTGNAVAWHEHSCPVWIYFPKDHESILSMSNPDREYVAEEGMVIPIPANVPHAVSLVDEKSSNRYSVALLLNPAVESD